MPDLGRLQHAGGGAGTDLATQSATPMSDIACRCTALAFNCDYLTLKMDLGSIICLMTKSALIPQKINLLARHVSKLSNSCESPCSLLEKFKWRASRLACVRCEPHFFPISRAKEAAWKAHGG